MVNGVIAERQIERQPAVNVEFRSIFETQVSRLTNSGSFALQHEHETGLRRLLAAIGPHGFGKFQSGFD